MNRRTFCISASAVALAPTALLTGCSYTKQDLLSDAAIVDDAIAAILTDLGQTALASEIQGYLTQFDQAVNSWNGSSSSAIVISLCQDIELALGDTGLPITIVAPADAAISALELIVESLGGSAVTASITPKALSVQRTVRSKPAPAKSRKAAIRGWNVAIVGTPLALHKMHEPLF